MLGELDREVELDYWWSTVDEDRARVDFELGVNISSTVSRDRLSIELGWHVKLDGSVSSSVAQVTNMILQLCHSNRRHDIKTCYYDVPIDSNIQLWYWDIQFWYLTFMFQYAILTFNSDTHIQHIFDKHVHVPRERAYLQLVSWKWICLAKIPPLLTSITSFLAEDKFGVFWSSEMYTWHFKASLMETLTSFTAPSIFTFRVKNSKGKKNLPLILYVLTWRQKSTKFPRPNLMITWKWSEGSIKWKNLLRIILFQKVGRLISTMAIPKD